MVNRMVNRVNAEGMALTRSWNNTSADLTPEVHDLQVRSTTVARMYITACPPPSSLQKLILKHGADFWMEIKGDGAANSRHSCQHVSHAVSQSWTRITFCTLQMGSATTTAGCGASNTMTIGCVDRSTLCAGHLHIMCDDRWMHGRVSDAAHCFRTSWSGR